MQFKSIVGFALAALFIVPAIARAADDRVALRVRFGMKAQNNADYSGSITPAAGKVESIKGWRWMPGDHASGNDFTVMVRRQPVQSSAERKRVQSGQKLPMQENGIIATLAGTKADEQITFTLKTGSFQFKLSDLPYGKKLTELNGDVEVTRVPASTQLTQSDEDEDYPSMAVAKDGTMYIAYASFEHGKDFMGARERPTTPESGPNTGPLQQGVIRKIEKPEDFDYLAQPIGGEKICLRICKNGTWSDPIDVTDGKTEVYRPSVAIDGKGKVWIFYPAHLNADKEYTGGDWELMARSFDAEGKNASEAINISSTPGTDFMPATATDSTGNVVLAWVGGREMDFNIFTATQAGEKFSAPARITDAKANEWEPVVAADANGKVAIAFDTYDKGDYDVMLALRDKDGKFAKPEPVAATLAFEVRPSLTYDNAGKLWIAWEESGDQWGKDFGPLKKKGIALYNGGRALAMKAMDADGQWLNVPDVMDAMPINGKGGGGGGGKKAAQKAPGMANPIAPTYPRLACDPKGQVYLAFRGRPGGNWRVAVGFVYCEFITRLDGDAWTEAAWLPRSNATLDNRPAIAAPTADGLMIVYAGDGRGELNPPKGAAALRNSSDPNELVQLASAEDPQVASDDGAADVIPVANPARRARRQAAAAAAASNPTTQGSADNAAPGAATPGAGGGRGMVVAGINSDLFTAFVRASDFGEEAKAPKLEKTEAAKPADPSPDTAAERKAIATIRDYRVNLNGESLKIWRGEFHRHTEYSPDGGGDGGLLDMWRYAIDAAGLDWIGDGDHDYGNGREYSWWTTQKAVTLFTVSNRFTPVFSYERSVSYPEGHRNCMFAQRGVRSLPRLPISDPDVFKPAPDTNMLYMYLKRFNALCAPHTSGTDMGTDWRNHDPEVEPFVEIYQGDRNNYERPDAPRSYFTEAKLKQSTPEAEAMGGFRPKGMVNLALLKGTKYAFESSSDHVSTHLSYCNVFLKDATRENILDAIRKKRVYAATDNIVADVRCKVGGTERFMGESFTTTEAPTLDIHFIGAQKINKVVIIKDDKEVHVATPNEQDVKFTWTDPNPTPGKESYYYVRAEQVPDMEGVSSGELAWASPMWITYNK